MQTKISGGVSTSTSFGQLNLLLHLLILTSSALCFTTPSKPVTKATRVVFSLLSLLLWGKLTYYLSFYSHLTLFVSIVYKVIYGIRVFNVILIVTIFAFANAFYFIGKNQVEFDGIETDEQPNYSKHLGTALEHIVKMIVLEFEFEEYTAGENPS